METDKNYLLVGSFVLVTILAILGFSIWILGTINEEDYMGYRINFAESVSGLSVGGAVKFRGVDVGKVEKIEINQRDSRLIRVDIKVLKTAPIKQDTVASLKLAGITGVIYIELSGGSPDSPRLHHDPEGDLPLIPAEKSSISAIVDILPEILQKTSIIADQLSKIFNDENVNNLNHMVGSWDRISTDIEGQMGQIGELVKNSSEVAANVRDITANSKQDIKSLADNLSQTSKQLSAFIGRTNQAAAPDYQEFYQLLIELKKTSRDTRELIDSLKEQPSRIIVPDKEKGIPAP